MVEHLEHAGGRAGGRHKLAEPPRGRSPGMELEVFLLLRRLDPDNAIFQGAGPV
jgi:hypothetical protein